MAAAVVFVMGGFYLLAGLGIAFEDRLTDSIGGAWGQGLGAWAIALGAFLWGQNLRRKGQ